MADESISTAQPGVRLGLVSNGDGTYSLMVSGAAGGEGGGGDASAANQSTQITLAGALTETAPASDTASSGHNGRLQRLAQRLTSLLAFFTGPTTGTQTSVASGVASVTILASNANRKGATITNDDVNNLLLLLGAGTASATNYSVIVPGNGGSFILDPGDYTGIIVGIWVADGSGSARVTEFS